METIRISKNIRNFPVLAAVEADVRFIGFSTWMPSWPKRLLVRDLCLPLRPLGSGSGSQEVRLRVRIRIKRSREDLGAERSMLRRRWVCETPVG